MELEPLQKPHPPIWYGLHAPESAERAARQGLQVVCLDPPAPTRAAIDRFRAVWREHHGAGVALPRDRPRPLHRRRRDRRGGAGDRAPRLSALAPELHLPVPPPRPAAVRTRGPPDFDTLHEVGQGVAGSPATVAAFLRQPDGETGANYCVGQFAFGDLTLAETLGSIELFARHVMPALKET